MDVDGFIRAMQEIQAEFEQELDEDEHREFIRSVLREKRRELLDNPPYLAYPKSVIQPVYREKHCRPKGNR